MIDRRAWRGIGLLCLLGACTPPPAPLITHQVALNWPLAPEVARVRYLGQVRGSAARAGVAAVVAGPGKDRTLTRPYAVTLAPGGLLVVGDPGSGRLDLFDLEARSHRVIESHGQTRLRAPVGVAADGEGRIYVADSMLARVLVFDRSGTPVGSFGGALRRPTGLAVDRRRGILYIVDTSAHRVHARALASGKYLFGFGRRGAGPGEFNFPTHTFFDPRRDELIVSDTLNFRVQRLDRLGRPRSVVGQLGDATGSLAKPKGVAVDSDGYLYVADALFNTIQIFDRKGQLMLYFGQAGRAPGDLAMPGGIFIDERDRIFVANVFNRRIDIYQYLAEKLP